jgi:hypothetical protein
MSAKPWNWVIGVGTLVAIVGLLFIPAALNGPAKDEGLIGAGGAMVGVGALIIGISLYMKASIIRAEIESNPQLSAMLAGKKLKPGCEICQVGAPVIYCSMHKKSLCGNCLSEHYDARHCVYMPAARRSPLRAAKGATVAKS